jgi:lysozyme
MDLKEMIRRHEGKRLKPYLCPAGKQTVGYGYNFDDNTLPPEILSFMHLYGRITEEMAEELLDRSIESATWQCRDLYPGFDGYPEARRFALVDFVLNIGAGGARKFKKMLSAIKEGNWQKAADKMADSLWFRQVGERGSEIVGMVRVG